MADHSKIEWTDATCEVCGKPVPTNKGNKRFCSRACYDVRPGTLTDTARNRERVHWIQRVWYGPHADMLVSIDGKRRGRSFEKVAATTTLPSLGFTKIIDLAALSHSSPVDFVATNAGKRILIEVTCGWQKRVGGKIAFSDALGLPLYVLAICPRRTTIHALITVKPGAKTVRVPVTLIREIAQQFGDSDGRRYKN